MKDGNWSLPWLVFNLFVQPLWATRSWVTKIHTTHFFMQLQHYLLLLATGFHFSYSLWLKNGKFSLFLKCDCVTFFDLERPKQNNWSLRYWFFPTFNVANSGLAPFGILLTFPLRENIVSLEQDLCSPIVALSVAFGNESNFGSQTELLEEYYWISYVFLLF